MCERSKSLIPGLLRKIDRVEKENAKIRAKSKILWAAMLLSWLVDPPQNFPLNRGGPRLGADITPMPGPLTKNPRHPTKILAESPL
ncbi:unnamed protein product [Prunus armeniaca]